MEHSYFVYENHFIELGDFWTLIASQHIVNDLLGHNTSTLRPTLGIAAYEDRTAALEDFGNHLGPSATGDIDEVLTGLTIHIGRIEDYALALVQSLLHLVLGQTEGRIGHRLVMGTLPKNTAVVIGADTDNTGVALYEHLPERGLSASRCSHEHPDYQLFIHCGQYNLRLRFCQHLSGAFQDGEDVLSSDWVESMDVVQGDGHFALYAQVSQPSGTIHARLLMEKFISNGAERFGILVVSRCVLGIMLVGQVVVERDRGGNTFLHHGLDEFSI